MEAHTSTFPRQESQALRLEHCTASNLKAKTKSQIGQGSAPYPYLLKRLGKAKLLSPALIAKLYRLGTEKASQQAQVCSCCGKYVGYRLWEHEQSLERVRERAYVQTCKFRLCPVCSTLRVMRLSYETMRALFELCRQLKAEGITPAFIVATQTMPNPQMCDLRDSIIKGSKAYRSIFNVYGRALKGSSVRARLSRVLYGHVRALEFIGDKTPAGQAHPHYHTLLVVDESYFSGDDYISNEEFSACWSAALKAQGMHLERDAFTSLTRIKPNPARTQARLKKGYSSEQIQELALMDAVSEVVKYCISAASVEKMDMDDFGVFLEQIKRVQTFAMGGRLRQIRMFQRNWPKKSYWDWRNEGYVFAGVEAWVWSRRKYKLTKTPDWLWYECTLNKVIGAQNHPNAPPLPEPNITRFSMKPPHFSDELWAEACAVF